MKLTNLGSILSAALVTSAAATAQADSGPGVFRLSVDPGVVQFAYGSTPGADVTSFGIGVAMPASTTASLSTGLPLAFAYQVNDALLLGARGGLIFQFSDPGNNLFRAHIMPFGEYMLTEGQMRWFVQAGVGFGVVAPEGSDASGIFGVQAGGGVHIFVEESFSLSPFLSLDYSRTLDRQFDTLSATLGCSFAGWID